MEVEVTSLRDIIVAFLLLLCLLYYEHRGVPKSMPIMEWKDYYGTWG